MAGRLQQELALQIGLDDATVKEQIWPALRTHKTAVSASAYLTSLLGDDTPARSLIDQYLRFAKLGPLPTPQPSKAAAPAKAPAPDLSRAFAGGRGAVYVKSRIDDGEGLFAGKAGRGQSRGGSSAESSRAPSPAMPPPPVKPSTPLQRQQIARQQQSTSGGAESEAIPIEISDEVLELIRTIDDAIAALEPKSRRRLNPCHCQARKHPLSTFVPICSNCALALCTLNSPTHPCPSCGKTDLISPARAASLLDQQRSRRITLLSAERERIRREREEEARRRAAETFPTLGGPSPSGSRSATPVPAPTSHKVLSLGKGGRVTTTTTTIRPSRPAPSARIDDSSDGPAATPLANRQARKEAARGWTDPYDQASAVDPAASEAIAGRPFAHVDVDMRTTYRPSALADA